jgi:gliding motility-associated-like protein
MKNLFCLVILSLFLHNMLKAQEHAGSENFIFNVCEGDTVLLGLEPIDGVIRIWPEFGPFLSFYGDSVLAYAENNSDTVLVYQNFLVNYVAENASFFADTITINIYPQPAEVLPLLNYSICIGDTITMYYAPVTGGYMYAEPSDLCEIDTLGSPNIRLFPAESTIYQLYVTNVGGCSIGPFDLSVNVQALTDSIVFALYDTICYNSLPFSLDSLIYPLSAEVSGPGVGADRYFYPALAGEGWYALTLSVGSGTCLVQLQRNIRILGENDVSFTDVPNMCQNDPKILLSGGVPAGGAYYVDDLLSEYVIPDTLEIGNHFMKYVYTGKDGCVISNTQNIFIKAIPERPSLIVDGDSITCFGDTLVLGASVSAPQYIWSNGDSSQFIYATFQGNYFVSIDAANGCTNFSDSLFLGFFPPPTINLFSPEWPNGFNVSAPGAGDGSIYLETEGGAPPYTVQWSNGATNEDLSGLNAGLYVVILTDTGGCSTRDSIFISDPVNTSIGAHIAKGEFTGIKIPNGFTPNGDGFNDTWKFDALPNKMERNEVLVYSRTGLLVYRANNYREQWDGRDLNGNMLPEGDYFWVFRSPNAVGILKGSVNLRR